MKANARCLIAWWRPPLLLLVAVTSLDLCFGPRRGAIRYAGSSEDRSGGVC